MYLVPAMMIPCIIGIENLSCCGRLSGMPSDKTRESDRQFIAEARREQEQRMKGYREKALKMFPPVCGRCGREFEGKKLRELTVHHKDHNHDNNPPDGSNWELLCIYCHDNEHSRHSVADWSDGPITGSEQPPSSTYNPFAGLDRLLKQKK
jgi:5-methylcytosine-specific restriction endonuclease McrA